MTEITTITLPSYDAATENFAEVGTAAWIAVNGGTDVTGQHGEADNLGTWVGDVELNGTIYRLTLVEMTGEITAEEVN